MTDRAENIKRVISTLESIRNYYESQAKPRRPLKQIRWALTCAIESMEELEQYRALGTVEELKEALEELDRYRDLGTIEELEEALNMLMV